MAESRRDTVASAVRVSRYVPHHYAAFIPRPNYVHQGTRHNSAGFRDHREFDPVPARETARAVFIGGSTTYETKVDDNALVFTARLEEHLREYAGAHHPTWGGTFEVINAGCGAATSAENLARLIFFVSDVQPRLVFIQHGFNDTWPRCHGQIRSDFSNFRRVWAEGVEDGGQPAVRPRTGGLISWILAAVGLRPAKSESIGDYLVNRDVPYDKDRIRTNSPAYFRRNTELMIAICRHLGATPVLMSEPFAQGYEDTVGWRAQVVCEHNEAMREMAEQAGVEFLNLYNTLRADELFADGKHFTEDGNAIKAKVLFDFCLERGLVDIAMGGSSGADAVGAAASAL